MQTTLLPKKDLKFTKRLTHGGARAKKRKTKRPLIPGAITHTVLKSSKAYGSRSFLKNKRLVDSLLKERARKFFVDILAYENMGNHIHLKLRFKDSKRFQHFLRTFMGLLARKLTKANRGKKFGKFWDGLAFTRVLTSKLEEYGLRKYFRANHIERENGMFAREEYLSGWKVERKILIAETS